MKRHLYRTPQSNLILECCASLFSLTIKLRDSERGVNVSDKFRTMIFVAFDEFERKAYENKISLKIVNESKFALSAYIDETVLTSLWPGRMQWMSNPLQLKYFGEHLGGEVFYDKLKKFRQSGERFVDLIELYYVCLQLGFEGVYRLRGFEKLLALQVDVKNQIDSYKTNKSMRLSPSGIPKDTVVETIRKEVPYWVIVSVAFSLVVITFIFYNEIIDEYSSESVEKINSINKKLDPRNNLKNNRKVIISKLQNGNV